MPFDLLYFLNNPHKNETPNNWAINNSSNYLRMNFNANEIWIIGILKNENEEKKNSTQFIECYSIVLKRLLDFHQYGDKFTFNSTRVIFSCCCCCCCSYSQLPFLSDFDSCIIFTFHSNHSFHWTALSSEWFVCVYELCAFFFFCWFSKTFVLNTYLFLVCNKIFL